MDLPTYTSIWRIEKRLYKLYDFRLPFPVPVVTLGVTVAIFVAWAVVMRLVGVEFAPPVGHIVWIVPPLVLAFLATRTFVDGKRPTELAASYLRYASEATVYCRLAPEREPTEIVVTTRVWHRHPQAPPLPILRGSTERDTAAEHAHEFGRAGPAPLGEVPELEEFPPLAAPVAQPVGALTTLPEAQPPEPEPAPELPAEMTPSQESPAETATAEPTETPAPAAPVPETATGTEQPARLRGSSSRRARRPRRETPPAPGKPSFAPPPAEAESEPTAEPVAAEPAVAETALEEPSADVPAQRRKPSAFVRSFQYFGFFLSRSDDSGPLPAAQRDDLATSKRGEHAPTPFSSEDTPASAPHTRAAARTEPPRELVRSAPPLEGDTEDFADEDADTDNVDWFSDLRRSSGDTPWQLRSKGAYAPSDTAPLAPPTPTSKAAGEDLEESARARAQRTIEEQDRREQEELERRRQSVRARRRAEELMSSAPAEERDSWLGNRTPKTTEEAELGSDKARAQLRGRAQGARTARANQRDQEASIPQEPSQDTPQAREQGAEREPATPPPARERGRGLGLPAEADPTESTAAPAGTTAGSDAAKQRPHAAPWELPADYWEDQHAEGSAKARGAAAASDGRQPPAKPALELDHATDEQRTFAESTGFPVPEGARGAGADNARGSAQPDAEAPVSWETHVYRRDTQRTGPKAASESIPPTLAAEPSAGTGPDQAGGAQTTEDAHVANSAADPASASHSESDPAAGSVPGSAPISAPISGPPVSRGSSGGAAAHSGVESLGTTGVATSADGAAHAAGPLSAGGGEAASAGKVTSDATPSGDAAPVTAESAPAIGSHSGLGGHATSTPEAARGADSDAQVAAGPTPSTVEPEHAAGPLSAGGGEAASAGKVTSDATRQADAGDTVRDTQAAAEVPRVRGDDPSGAGERASVSVTPANVSVDQPDVAAAAESSGESRDSGDDSVVSVAGTTASPLHGGSEEDAPDRTAEGSRHSREGGDGPEDAAEIGSTSSRAPLTRGATTDADELKAVGTDTPAHAERDGDDTTDRAPSAAGNQIAASAAPATDSPTPHAEPRSTTIGSDAGDAGSVSADADSGSASSSDSDSGPPVSRGIRGEASPRSVDGALWTESGDGAVSAERGPVPAASASGNGAAGSAPEPGDVHQNQVEGLAALRRLARESPAESASGAKPELQLDHGTGEHRSLAASSGPNASSAPEEPAAPNTPDAPKAAAAQATTPAPDETPPPAKSAKPNLQLDHGTGEHHSFAASSGPNRTVGPEGTAPTADEQETQTESDSCTDDDTPVAAKGFPRRGGASTQPHYPHVTPKPPLEIDHATDEQQSFAGAMSATDAADDSHRRTIEEIEAAEKAALRARQRASKRATPAEASQAPRRDAEAEQSGQPVQPPQPAHPSEEDPQRPERINRSGRLSRALRSMPTGPQSEALPLDPAEVLKAQSAGGDSERDTGESSGAAAAGPAAADADTPSGGRGGKPRIQLDHGTGEQSTLHASRGNGARTPAPSNGSSESGGTNGANSQHPAVDTGGRKTPTSGWRRIAQAITGARTEPTLDLPQEYAERLRAPIAHPRSVVVLGCTGGAGQSMTALLLGHTLASYRDDRVVAVDANPSQGGMSRRVNNGTGETLTSLLATGGDLTGYQSMRGFTTVTDTGLEVVGTKDDPYVQTLDDEDYSGLSELLGRFYTISLIDPAATGVARALPVADALVLVAPASTDAARSVAMTFEWLDGHGYGGLRSRAVLVLNGVSKRTVDDVAAAERMARGQCRAVVRTPWDEHVSDGRGEVVVNSLRPVTRKAYGALGGVVVSGLVAPEEARR